MLLECVNDARYMGKPCKHGHNGLRYKLNRNCVMCCRLAAPAHNKKAYWKNPEKARLASATWQKNNIEKSNARKKAWTVANRDKHRISVNRWHEANPEKRINVTRNRRARIRGAGGSHTANDVIAILDAQKNTCFYCDNVLVNYHVDHFVPVVLGGSNERFNIVCACASCNLRKSDTPPIMFMRFEAKYPHFWSERK